MSFVTVISGGEEAMLCHRLFGRGQESHWKDQQGSHCNGAGERRWWLGQSVFCRHLGLWMAGEGRQGGIQGGFWLELLNG